MAQDVIDKLNKELEETLLHARDNQFARRRGTAVRRNVIRKGKPKPVVEIPEIEQNLEVVVEQGSALISPDTGNSSDPCLMRK